MQMIHLIFLLVTLEACSNPAPGSQQSSVTVNQDCEGCEAVHESPIAHSRLPHTDTTEAYALTGPKLHVTGVVYQRDGKTPASDVVLYYYHTDQTGSYPKKGDEKGWALRHGYLRGWLKTNKKGEYAIYTLRPVSYPNRTDPAHIHMTVKEADLREYWIDDVVFDDDPLVNERYRGRVQNQGGDGIVKTKTVDGIQHARRDIFLGKNIR